MMLPSLRRLLVRGMKCEGCAHHLKGRIEAVPGVSAVSIDFSSKQVTAHSES